MQEFPIGKQISEKFNKLGDLGGARFSAMQLF